MDEPWEKTLNQASVKWEVFYSTKCSKKGKPVKFRVQQHHRIKSISFTSTNKSMNYISRELCWHSASPCLNASLQVTHDRTRMIGKKRKCGKEEEKNRIYDEQSIGHIIFACANFCECSDMKVKQTCVFLLKQWDKMERARKCLQRLLRPYIAVIKTNL